MNFSSCRSTPEKTRGDLDRKGIFPNPRTIFFQMFSLFHQIHFQQPLISSQVHFPEVFIRTSQPVNGGQKSHRIYNTSQIKSDCKKLGKIVMMTRICLLVVFTTIAGLAVQQPAQAQFRGRSDRGGSDRGGFDREEMRRRFEEMRSRGGFSRGGSDRGGFGRGGFSRGGSDRGGFGGFSRGGSDRGGDDRGGDNRGGFGGFNRGGDNRGSAPKIQPYVPTPHAPIGVEIPAQFAAGDADGDGQIDLLEWRQWKPQEIANFMKMDTNRDGFLTAREMVIAENYSNDAGTPTAALSANTVAVSPSTSPTPTPIQGTDAEGNTVATAAGEKPSAAEARFVFPKLDTNHDNVISADEWEGSKSIREGFENKGINVGFPLNLETFLERYPNERIVPQMRLPGQ